MSLQRNRFLSIFYLSAVTLQAGISLIQLMDNPSEEKNVFFLGYSLSRLVVASLFLIIIVLCIRLFVSIYHNKSLFPHISKKYVEQPIFLVLLFAFLLILILSSSILLIITHNLNSGGHTVNFSTLSIENLILQIMPLFSPWRDYLFRLLPLFKWCLAFGMDTTFFIFGINALRNKPSSINHPKHYQELILIILSVILFSLLTLAIYFPGNQSLIFNIGNYHDWLSILALIASFGLLISLVYYSKNSIHYFVGGLLFIGIMFNLIDHTYVRLRLELARKPSNTLESFLITPDENYHFREYQIYQKLSRDYAGKEIIISQELLDEFSLTPTRLIIFGRLSRVTTTQDAMILDDDIAKQLLNMQYTEIMILSKDRASPDDHKWIFVEAGLKDATSIQVQKGAQNRIFVYPVQPDAVSDGMAE